MQTENPLLVIEKAAPVVKSFSAKNAKLEPAKNALNKGEMKEIYSKSLLMSGRGESNSCHQVGNLR